MNAQWVMHKDRCPVRTASEKPGCPKNSALQSYKKPIHTQCVCECVSKTVGMALLDGLSALLFTIQLRKNLKIYIQRKFSVIFKENSVKI